MIKDIAIYGAGGFGREIALMIQQINEHSHQWNFIGFFDDNQQAKRIDGFPMLGGLTHLNEWSNPISIAICVADPATRATIVAKIKNHKVEYPVLIHPSSIVNPKVNRFGFGTIITAGCIFTTNLVIENFVLVNLATTIGHDSVIRSFCSIMPGSRISGNITIGERTLIGTGVKIIQNLRIGSNCKVGAGAVVIRDVEDGLTVVGVPARQKLKK